jgi:[ribosomal protein S5]-alanine N-acetyltransferase
MAFLRKDAPNQGGKALEGHGVTLRAPENRDYVSWANVRAQSRTFLTPWEPTWPLDDLSRDAYRRRLKRYDEDRRLGNSFAYFSFRNEDARLVGGVTLGNVRRGVAQTASIGYWAGEPFQRRGYTLAAVQAVLRHAFDDLALNRVEASCMPENEASRRLLLSIGFQQEGVMRSALKINGVWRDHLLFGILKGVTRPSISASVRSALSRATWELAKKIAFQNSEEQMVSPYAIDL